LTAINSRLFLGLYLWGRKSDDAIGGQNVPDMDAHKKQSTLLVLFIPSADRYGESLGKKKQKPGFAKP
jgi:hypothetical protein